MAPPSYLKPERLDLQPTDEDASKKFSHWLQTLNNFLELLDGTPNKLHILHNFVGHHAYTLIEEETTFDNAVKVLKSQYQKPVNEIYARHVLSTRRQLPDESIDDYVQNLRVLARKCNFQDVTAAVYQEESIRNSFIAGLRSNYIRQRLLENQQLDLKTAIASARALDVSVVNSESYVSNPQCASAHANREKSPNKESENESFFAAVRSKKRFDQKETNSYDKCEFCGQSPNHPRFKCPAREAECFRCHRRGHFGYVCRTKPARRPHKFSAAATNSHQNPESDDDQFGGNSSWPPFLCSVPGKSVPESLSKSTIHLEINNKSVCGVADSASCYSFIHPSFAKSLNLHISPANEKISMASKSLMTEVSGYSKANIKVSGTIYDDFKLYVLPNLCADMILGLDFLALHQSVTLKYGGSQPPLTICGLTSLKVDPPDLFENLTPNVKPIADKRRYYSLEDREFIKSEVARLLKEDIIEESKSPWRAQIVIVKKGEKKRMALDYSQTINLFTRLDAFPLPLIKDIVNQIAQYAVYSTIDLRAAYHQIKIKPKDRAYTAFEANGRLYQFTRVPFGVTNGVSAFQREMTKMVDKYSLKGVFPYLDNVTICGKDQLDHDMNLEKFKNAASDMNLTYNPEKCVFSTTKLSILGCVVEKGKIRPDPERMRPLMELPFPKDTKSLKRLMGFFSYYSCWIPKFSDKIRPVSQTTSFPISKEAEEAINLMKKDIENSMVGCIDETIPFTVECDASDVALAATLNQNGRPVSFFARSLQNHELRYPSVEKEAMSIIEAVRHWRQFLSSKRFNLITDQRSVAFMFDSHRNKSKIKNEKFIRWRLELSTYNYDITYRPGRLNEPADALSRVCALTSTRDLKSLHTELCHPGVTRLYHFIKSKNLPYSIEEVRAVTRSCSICAQCKPQFYKNSVQNHLIKSTRPFERLNVDFKGPLDSTNKNKYFLHIIDEWSRFPFVFPCPDVSAKSVIQALVSLFSVFGLPGYIHSDRGSGFMSKELRTFLSSRGIASSNTTSYNPAGNGQIEKENSTVWKAVTLTLKSRNLPLSHWQEVLPEVLHSVRSLLCTATNETPHDRLFTHPRRAATGATLPNWLCQPGPVLLRKHVRNQKSDPLVEPVELLHANPTYAHVKFADGREDSVSLKDLAPAGNPDSNPSNPPVIPDDCPPAPSWNTSVDKLDSTPIQQEPTTQSTNSLPMKDTPESNLRRSSRTVKPIDRLGI